MPQEKNLRHPFPEFVKIRGIRVKVFPFICVHLRLNFVPPFHLLPFSIPSLESSKINNQTMKKSSAFLAAISAVLCFSQTVCQAWDYEGHRFVNQLALASLPTNFPAFVKTPEARERIAFLAGEPDRWRNTQDLNHFNGPDHYIDLDELTAYGIDEHNLTHFRYDFAAQLALARAAHPENFPPIDPERNSDHTRQLVGFLPWAIMENFDKLKSGFSYLKAFEKNGTPEEIANAQQNIIYIMGVMGHYVGDAAQPLHTTVHHHGWVGENPQNYTRDTKIHGKVDSYFIHLDAAGFDALKSRIHTAQLPATELGLTSGDTFSQITTYILNVNKEVVPLYELEKAGKLFGTPEATAEGREFLSKQLVIGGQMLGDIWYAAWQSATEDTYLESALARRKLPPGDPSQKN